MGELSRRFGNMHIEKFLKIIELILGVIIRVRPPAAIAVTTCA